MITAATYLKRRLFSSNEKLDRLEAAIFDEVRAFGWEIQAWAVFSNHYHLIIKSPENAESLKSMMQALHSKTAIWLNEMDDAPGRTLWYRYWDTCLTYQNSYLARLNYVNHNPVKHCLADNPEMYKWCSMAWFKQTAPAGFQRTVGSFKTDKVKVIDDFD